MLAIDDGEGGSRLPKRYGEAVDDDAADGEQPDDDAHHVLEVGGVRAHSAVGEGNGVQKVEADIEVEDGRDAIGAEEADEGGLLELFNLGNLLCSARTM